jgi:hypothetical protein
MGVHWSANFKALGDKLCRVAPNTFNRISEGSNFIGLN